MPDESKRKMRGDELKAVLDEYAVWFMQALRRISYPQETSLKKAPGPKSFARWVESAERSSEIESGSLGSLKRINADLLSSVEKLIEESSIEKKAPAYEDFDKAVTLYEEFGNFIRRVMKDNSSGNAGIDPVTGLRTVEAFFKDVELEKNRLERQGKSFCVGMSRIDSHDDFRHKLNPGRQEEGFKSIADVLRKSLRSFDDAYRIEEGFFLFCLKQTTLSGGMSALRRIRANLEQKNFSYEIDGKNIALSLSSSITEPLPQDDIAKTIENMKKELTASEGKPGLVIEHLEISPLQRLIKEGRV